MTPEKFTLLIVDCQNDLTREDGLFYVPSCERIIPKICKFIRENKDKIDRVILAKSNHPSNYCQFTKNGGAFPKHCIEDTAGSKIDSRITNVIKESKVNYIEICHGEVSDFAESSTSKYSQVIDNIFVLATATDACKVYTDDIVVCGMTGDDMVAETINDLSRQRPHENIHIFIDGVANINQDHIMNILEKYTMINVI